MVESAVVENSQKRKRLLRRLVESSHVRRLSPQEYRRTVRHVYGGLRGQFLAACSLVSLHLPLGHRLFRARKFDARGAKSVLDVGSGVGQLAKHLLRYGDEDARITCIDLSFKMLRRARRRLSSRLPAFLAADLSSLPFADNSFDCITCGYVLEHLPEAHVGLGELARVLMPGGRMLLLTTEDTISGAWTSRLFCCRTYNRDELRNACDDLGLTWKRELWFTGMHKLFRAGGIVVEIEKRRA